MRATARSTLVVIGGLAAAVTVAGLASTASAAGPEECSPSARNRPVCPAGTPLSRASFLDPTATVEGAARIHLAEQVYVAPFAALHALAADVRIGPESNVQDSVRVFATQARAPGEVESLARVGLRPSSGVRTGERVILAHGSAVRGPARIGDGPVKQVRNDDGELVPDSGVFVSFSAEVDGAVLERDSGLSTLARVGPGVRLRSGFIVLPGKNVTSQREADEPRLGKVRPITDADRQFNAGVVEVNTGLAREYSRVARQNPSLVRGANIDPGGNPFDPRRDLPRVDGELCTGPAVRQPGFRNRIIGNVCFADTFAALDRAMGSSISLRADEGGPFEVGVVGRMADRVVFHALEGQSLRVGDRVSYGRRVLVHGGGRPQIDPTTGLFAPTVIGDDVQLGDESVVFRSLLRNGVRVGARSAVVGSELRLGQVVEPRTIYANDEVAGRVEW